MKTDAKKNLLAASLYIDLAVMIVTVVSVTVLSVAKKAKETLPTPAPTESTEAETDTNGEEPTSKPTEPTDAPTEPKPTEPQSSSSSTGSDEPADAPAPDPLPDSFTLPVNGYISKGYEPDLPVWSTTMEDYRIHDGIDVICEDDAEVYVCADGTVESIYEDPLMGYAITVYHGGGLRSTYMGLSGDYPQSVGTGTRVNKGQVLGWVGDTALIECAEPTHLHFVMTLDEETVDPQNYIEFESATMNSYE